MEYGILKCIFIVHTVQGEICITDSEEKELIISFFGQIFQRAGRFFVGSAE